MADEDQKQNAVAVRAPSIGDFTPESLAQAALEAAKETAKGSATGDSMREGMGNQRPKLDRVRVIHNGAASFRRGEKLLSELVGVVVAHTFHNTYFDKPYDDRVEGERPPCFSNDAVTIAANAETPQNPEGGCHTCSRNRDARDGTARRAAFDRPVEETCSNYFSLAILVPGEEIPVIVQYPYGSFKSWGEYVQAIGSKGRFRPSEVVTRFKLKNSKNAGGKETSVGVFEFVGPLPAPIREQVAGQVEAYRAVLRREASDGERDASSTTSASDAVRQAKAAAQRAAQSGQGPGI